MRCQASGGQNLQDHYAPRLSARVKGIETLNERARGLRLLGEIGKYLIGAESIGTERHYGLRFLAFRSGYPQQ